MTEDGATLLISVKRYNKEDENTWNKFNSECKNGLFMFDRQFMDYHSDRFQDHSLLFYDDDSLIALLPMNESENSLISHGGLTYGGFLTNSKMKQHTMNDCFQALVEYARDNGIVKIYYKQIPAIFHKQPAEEDRYSLFINKASIEKIEASTAINLHNPLKMPKGRKAQLSRARREGVEIVELTDPSDFLNFIDLENEVLLEHHGIKAVHSGEELVLLHSRFPEHIHLLGAIKDQKLIAGTLVFEYEQVVHTQYMAANKLAREIGALDLTISYVIEKYRHNKAWLDFGISTENGGRYLNQGLISQKEGFGGRTIVYQMWLVNV